MAKMKSSFKGIFTAMLETVQSTASGGLVLLVSGSAEPQYLNQVIGKIIQSRDITGLAILLRGPFVIG